MPPKPRPDKTPWYRSWLLKSTLLLVLVVLFLGGVIWVGRWAQEELHGNPRFEVAFMEVDCEPPPGMDKKKFLGDVLYYASPRLPERLSLIDDALKTKLRDGFAKHPWVERVDSVEVIQPKQILVKLTYRTPVLAVKAGADLLAVDGAGVLLPKDAPTHGLPIFEGNAKTPKGIGERWGDPNVEAAARKAKR